MKKIPALLFFAQIICFNMVMSQTTQVKQASDACPSWNKKQISTSTDYAYLSKRSAAKDNSDFSTPKYQSIYSRRNGSTPVIRNGQTAAISEKQNAENKKQKTFLPVAEKSKPSRAVREPEIKTEEKAVPVQTDEFPVKENPEPVKAKGKDAASASGAEKKQTAAAKKTSNVTHQKTHWFKKIGFRKKNAVSCPSF